MNYYEQFYDDLEFDDEEEEMGYDPYDARSYSTNPGYGYEEEWTHRDQKYPEPKSQPRGHHGRESPPDAYYTRGYEGRREEDFDEDYDREEGYGGRGRGHNDRGRGFWDSGRGYGQRGRGFGERGRGFRGRGFGERGRGPRTRGRGFPTRGRGDFDRGRGRGDFDRGRGRGAQRGGVKGSLAMSFVKAKDPDPLQPVPDAGQGFGVQENVTAPVQPAVPVCPGYGYGVGSDFEVFMVHFYQDEVSAVQALPPVYLSLIMS